MAVKVLRYRTLIFYSDVNSKECSDHISKMQEEGWERIDERSLVNNGYEVEFEKWIEVDLTAPKVEYVKDQASINEEDNSLSAWSDIIMRVGKSTANMSYEQEPKAVKEAVDEIVNIYYREDYEYVVGLAKKGKKAENPDASVDGEVEFIKRNQLCKGLSEKDIYTVAKLALQQIKAIEDEIYAKYYGK